MDFWEYFMGNKQPSIITLVAMILATKIAFIHQKENLVKGKRDSKKLIWIGLYITINTLLTYFSIRTIDATCRLMMQVLTGICFLSILLFSVNRKKERVKRIKIKEIRYNATAISSRCCNDFKQDNVVKIVENATKYIALLDHLFAYKESLHNMIDKFYEWTMLFSEKRKTPVYESLQPIEITVDDLIRKLKSALVEKIGYLPRLFIEKINCPTGVIPKKIVCNVSQVTRLLVTAVLRVANLDSLEREFVKLQLYTTQLQIDKRGSIKHQETSLMMYRAIALVLSNGNTPSDELPKIKSCYKHVPDNDIELIKGNKIIPNYVDNQKETIKSIIDTHYGYLEYPKINKNAILLVFPINIETICKQKMPQLRRKHLGLEASITVKDEVDATIVLMQFHDFACRSFKKINPELIAGTLLFLKRRFGTKQHLCKKLFYIRSVGIAKILTKWIYQDPEPIYACLLYDLVRHTDLSLSYIEAHYSQAVHMLVQNILDIDKHETIASSLPDVKHRGKPKADQDDPELFVLYIKLSERLYDLRHAESYTNLDKVKDMIKETVTIDIELAKKYLNPEIGEQLKMAARNAEECLNKKED